ncbi:pectate lyase superfamily protein-domain-containing protein [Podospora didyma]|uniref:Pectate lyase superfamily protein-domain-containing protein n=1 Tax=Podospora didyma TaxID=330526 RepID=A0AAE0N6N3_9PEZI|nr:pectate lyase superfamily protein-domain-containing protein [Podospora didyma]
MKFFSLLVALAATVQATFWMEDIQHSGISPFNSDKSYTVFRNVKAHGAKGDGVTDDTDAINEAISSGNRCGGNGCVGSTLTPAVVYFPPGTYLVSRPIISYYYTQIIGDPNDMPVIKGSAEFPWSNGMLDADPYVDATGSLTFKSTNVFFRQIRNIVFDTRDISGTVNAVHWPSAQATSIQNCVFLLSTRDEDMHTGIFMEEGSGGVMNDLVFYGGRYGAQFGNQQYTMRNLTFNGCKTAIQQIWNWGWTYKSLSINNCEIGINMTSDVGSVVLLDSQFFNVSKALVTGRSCGKTNTTGKGSLMVENVQYTNVPTVLESMGGKAFLLGDPSGTVYDWGYARGNLYAPHGPELFEGRDPSYFNQPHTLKLGNTYYERSKPQYESYPASAFLSARQYKAAGDGVIDDTAALNSLFLAVSKNSSKIAFLDAGFYKVTDTVNIPPNTRIVGEGLAAVIMGTGPKFSDAKNPYPVVKIGQPGETGQIEMSDIIVSTQGATAGAILIEYNLNTPTTENQCREAHPPSGLWDVHIRIGGFAGSGLQVAQCLTTPTQANYVNPACIAAYMSVHVTKSASNLYVENSWLWVADHDIEDWNNTQISVFAGRGLLVEGSRIWLVGTAVEHHTLYQYQLVNASDIWMGQIQTETPYYQPNPPAPAPFTQQDVARWDPDFAFDCKATIDHGAITKGNLTLQGNPPCEMAWGLRILSSQNVVIFGAGLYSFFHNYNTSCSTLESGENCQSRIFWVGPSLENTQTATNGTTIQRDGLSSVNVYNLNTVGSVSMITRQGADMAFWHENVATFASTLAVFRF